MGEMDLNLFECNLLEVFLVTLLFVQEFWHQWFFWVIDEEICVRKYVTTVFIVHGSPLLISAQGTFSLRTVWSEVSSPPPHGVLLLKYSCSGSPMANWYFLTRFWWRCQIVCRSAPTLTCWCSTYLVERKKKPFLYIVTCGNVAEPLLLGQLKLQATGLCLKKIDFYIWVVSSVNAGRWAVV